MVSIPSGKLGDQTKFADEFSGVEKLIGVIGLFTHNN
jgi:hypothetical protein